MSSKIAQPNVITVKVEPVTAAEDFTRFFDVTALAFGQQVNDGIWTAMNSGWDTPKGREIGIHHLINRWSSTTKDRNGNPNTIFLKATVSRQDEPGKEDIAGAAIWVQASMVEGYGDMPTTDMDQSVLDELLPGNLEEQNYVRQLKFGLHRRRVEVVKEIASSSSPAVIVLDLCVVDPAYQRLGIATKLVEWGVSEAKRRGGLECILEASNMGRHVYKKLGFQQEGSEFEYQVDEQFQHRDRPSNIFMRTGYLGIRDYA
ncbi:conserved hypothetical protein [Talaromyces stipitatus ATCC 10500]|uniref:N-acetyltransferase domain-containing protein n=1 Tax=Talaromyces stipitatus (strain ATCC 10500 / CBS 375.48 / QM 6759 / NRRL 1006) TaxID=441959 RepID=B8M7P8_TALSN|nr:uncharacterized protein TSTA_028830 [Talaromyces stipitatus ATCC 10500]EED19601.1 conserved hypothetical protein [Talaromyces stipitatus ATCC 10500]